MNNEVRMLKPEDVFSFFDDLCGMPHPSGHTDKIADYLVKFAEDRALDYKRDERGNVIIYKCSSENSRSTEPLILQAHIDMVPNSADYANIDFTKEPIRIFTDDDFIRTYGTTLGADDGIGVAMILAVLNDKTLSHPPIEALFTTDEEVGMLGAAALDASFLNGKRMINLDHESENLLVCGCTGGSDVHCSLPVKREERTGIIVNISLSGLIGGHSGLEIDKGRANANILMTRLLLALHKEIDFGLVSMRGGTKETAIPAECEVRISVYPTVFGIIENIVKSCTDTFKNEFSGVEENINITASEGEFETSDVLESSSLDSVLKVLAAVPNGAFEFIPELPDVVQTSSNLGVLRLAKNNLFFTCCVRSSVPSVLDWYCRKIEIIAEGFGGSSYKDSGYPGWMFRKDSPLQRSVKEAYHSVYGKEMKVSAVHAGLECGVFSEKIKDLDVVSLGPDVFSVHTPFEHLSISSVERTYALLKAILETV